VDDWQPDVLGEGFESLTLPLEDDDEGPVVTTLVRYLSSTPEPVRAVRVVLYLHGWSDYFFQAELARFWTSHAAAFYALDLRKHGRSLREHQTPNYTDNLDVYDEDLAAALDVIEDEHGPHARVLLMGHSTGGLIACLWADRFPGRVSSLVLNSPWLEMQGSAVVRAVSAPAIAQLARFQPKAALPNIDPGWSTRAIQEATGAEWSYDERWRPTPMFPVHPGWLNAIITGHATVARGLSIDVPILVAASDRSIMSTTWSEEMRRADVVIDVEAAVSRAVQLGPVVTVVRIAGGLHDLVLSARAPRRQFYAELDRWLAGYGWA